MGHHYWAFFGSFENERSGIEAQAGFLFDGSVAGDAVVREEGLDLGFIVHRVARWQIGSLSQISRNEEQP